MNKQYRRWLNSLPPRGNQCIWRGSASVEMKRLIWWRYSGRAQRGVSRSVGLRCRQACRRARGTVGEGRATHGHPAPTARAAPTAAQAPLPGGSRHAGTVHVRQSIRRTHRAAHPWGMSFASHWHHVSSAAASVARGRPWVARSVMGGAGAVGVGCRPRPRRAPIGARLRPSAARARRWPLPGTIPNESER